MDIPAFTRLTYQDAMARYGSDKPDLRFGLEFGDASELVRQSEFKVFKDTVANEKGAVIGLCVPKPEVSRKDIDNLTELAKAEGAVGLAYFKVEEGRLESPIAKFIDEKTQKSLIALFKASPGDLLLFIADERKKAQKILGALRLHISRWKEYVKAGTFHFSWVTDFPLFQWNEEGQRWDSEHHPFTSPNFEDWEKYKSAGEYGKIRSRAYDLVLNGNEIASGSVRIHEEHLQKQIFEMIGLSEKDINVRFAFLLKAFQYGAPPHGGIALGIDRVMTILLGLDSIREVIAFPKNQKAMDTMTDAPSPVDEKQLRELGVKLR